MSSIIPVLFLCTWLMLLVVHPGLVCPMEYYGIAGCATLFRLCTCVLYPEMPSDVAELDFTKPPPNDEQRLLRHIMREYDKSVRPVYSAKSAVSVAIGLTLAHIFNVDEKKQVLSMNVWLEQEWRDERISWNPEEYGNITQLTVPTRFIWTPDIVLYNNAEDFSGGILQTNVAVYERGQVLWAPPVKFHSTCKLDVSFFPFDDQICLLRFGSWIYDRRQVDVTNRSDQVTLDKDSYIENGEWEVVSTYVNRHVNPFPCCPNTTFPVLTFTLHLRRRTLYYLYNIIIPCVMLSVLTLMQFWLPCESGEKVTLGLTVLLAYSVFSFNIAENMPETSEVIPLIAIYLMSIMGISAISVTLSVIVLNMRHGGERCRPVPPWLQYFTYRILGSIICWRTDRDFPARQQKTQISFQQAFHSLSEQLSRGANAGSPGHPPTPMIHSFLRRGMPRVVSPPGASTSLNVDKNLTFTERVTTTPVKSDVAILGAPFAARPPLRRKSQVRKEIMDRAGRLMDRMEKEKKVEELQEEWRKVSRIFDQFFFAMIMMITTLVTVIMLMVAPRFSNRHFYHESGIPPY